jgi:mRNA-degrading endonuclease RelE of RelBE toxin-antitoxin system
MTNTAVYSIRFVRQTLSHFDVIERKYHPAIRRAINDQLSINPITETRNRKLMRQPAPFDATWELRCGPGNRFRVLYTLDEENEHTVVILAVGVKEGNRLFVAGKEIIP